MLRLSLDKIMSKALRLGVSLSLINKLLLVLLSLLLLSSRTPIPALAHGFGIRPDLPIPEAFYWIGGGAAVVVSFIIVSLFVGKESSHKDYWTHNLLRYRPLRWIHKTGALTGTFKILSVIFLFLIIIAGLFGTQVPQWNITPTMVWIIWWVGFGFVHALIGNVWAFVNPWKATYEWVARLRGRSGGGDRPRLRYPRRLGVWPAFALFLFFVWIELVYPESSSPRMIALFAIAYSIIAWIGMFLFGKNTWLYHGEPFTVFFNFLSMIAPTEVRIKDRGICQGCVLNCLERGDVCINCFDCSERARDKEVNLRPLALGLIPWRPFTIDRVAFILLMLSSVTFDGLSRTWWWFDTFGIPKPPGPEFFQRAKGLFLPYNSVGLVLFFLFFMGIYHLFAYLMKLTSRSDRPWGLLALFFALSLLPIAMVYQFAHYTLFLTFNGQFIIRLISDPFGFGWNIFGTRFLELGGLPDFLLVWNYQVAIIVIGHIIGVYTAHLIALRVFPTVSAAIRSQFPMLVLMVFYTMTGLWLLSTPAY